MAHLSLWPISSTFTLINDNFRKLKTKKLNN
jgi:hypothetical protein